MSPSQSTGPSSDSKPRKGFDFRIFCINTMLVCGSLLFTFVVAEIVLRVLGVEPKTATALNSYFQYDPQTGWTGRPNAAMRFATTAFSGYTSHGPDGFRVIAKPYETASNVVWCIGDSGTWGWGVSDGETYVDRLNELADEQTVFRNLGVCGFSSAQQYLLIRSLVEKHPDQIPDTILLLFCGNDLPENVDWQDQSPPRPYYTISDDGTVEMKNYPTAMSSMSIRSWLKRNSLAYNHLNFYLIFAKRVLKNRQVTGNFNVPPDSPESQWQVLEYSYTQIRDYCRDQGIKFVPVFLPGSILRFGNTLTPALNDYDERTRARLHQVTDNLGLDLFDITEDVRDYFTIQRDESERLSFVRDPHFNAKGHRLIGDAIWSRVRSTLNADRPMKAMVP